MDVLELKFLLELLGFPEYRAPVSKIKPNPQTKADQRDSICRNLSDRELVAFSFEVTKFTAAPPGKSLLKLDMPGLPVSPEELAVLQACADGEITPSQTGLAVEKQQPVIQGLAQRGLIKVLKTQIKDVWITERGQQYLLYEYLSVPSRDNGKTGSARDKITASSDLTRGNVPILSLELLGNYLRFLRKVLPGEVSASQTRRGDADTGKKASISTSELATYPLTDADILQTIRDLDRQLGTDNYLPIFYLRQKLQPPLTREELDQALYRLQRNDKIELSSLQEAIAYNQDQIDAGIAQDVGGPLFFIIGNG